MLLGKGMKISLGCGLCLGLVQRWGLQVGLGLRLLNLGLLWLVVRVVLELGGSCSVLTETTGLSGAVDLTQCVQSLALGVLQQVGLALRGRQKEEPRHQQHRTTKVFKAQAHPSPLNGATFRGAHLLHMPDYLIKTNTASLVMGQR